MNAKPIAAALAAVVVVYMSYLVWQGMTFIAEGTWMAALFGLAILGVPGITGWAVAREWRFGRAVQRLGRQLGDEGGLPADDLPRRPSGRPELAAAEARFAQVEQEVQGQPDDWRAWFRLSIAYDDCGDRRRARQAMREAIRRHAD